MMRPGQFSTIDSRVALHFAVGLREHAGDATPGNAIEPNLDCLRLGVSRRKKRRS